MTGLRELIQRRHQTAVNLVLFLSIAQYVYRETEISRIFSGLRLVDLTFFIHNLVFMVIVLIRREYRRLDRDWRHWLVAMGAFFSNLFFIKSTEASSQVAVLADAISLFAIIMGILSFLSLGRSFGILPAVREIRTGGLYRFVRHPMYLSDILFKLPIVIKYFSAFNLAVFLLSALLYMKRAGIEESLLLEDQEYRRYSERVRYRFIPYIY
ncbi:MAG: DUF1295 domain-containing protein [Nitrospirales bacterium]|nr:DUF1295 domain-containing protein [Nitrospirales bacterium]